jgi:hypothetical protein
MHKGQTNGYKRVTQMVSNARYDDLLFNSPLLRTLMKTFICPKATQRQTEDCASHGTETTGESVLQITHDY